MGVDLCMAEWGGNYRTGRRSGVEPVGPFRIGKKEISCRIFSNIRNKVLNLSNCWCRSQYREWGRGDAGRFRIGRREIPCPIFFFEIRNKLLKSYSGFVQMLVYIYKGMGYGEWGLMGWEEMRAHSVLEGERD